jgi:hypothetical protein
MNINMQKIPPDVLEIKFLQNITLLDLIGPINLQFLPLTIQPHFTMKAFAILSFLGLLSSTIIAAPSHFGKRDFNVFLHTPASDHIQTNLSPSLRHGVYTITSPALDHDFAIGQDTADFPHFPKQIKTVATSDPAFQTNVTPHLYILLFVSHTDIYCTVVRRAAE